MKKWFSLILLVALLLILPIFALAADYDICPGQVITKYLTYTVGSDRNAEAVEDPDFSKYRWTYDNEGDESFVSVQLIRDPDKPIERTEKRGVYTKIVDHLILKMTGVNPGSTHVYVKYNNTHIMGYWIAVGHAWNNGVVTKAASLDEEGVRTYTCSRCQLIREEVIPRTKLKITYKLNGGTNHKDNPSTFTADQTITLKDPSRAGCSFLGWYTDSAMTQRVTTISGRKDFTLYAKWDPTNITRTEFVICPEDPGKLSLTHVTASESTTTSKYTLSSSDSSVLTATLSRPTMSSYYNYSSGSLVSVDNYLTLVFTGHSPGVADFNLYYDGEPIFCYRFTVGHDWSQVEYTWNGYSEVQAYRVCGRNPEHEEKETAAVQTEAFPKNTETGQTRYTAKFTNPEFVTQTKILDNIPPLMTIENGVLTGYSGNASTIDIPNTVTAIGENVFKDKAGITDVSIPDSVISIGNSAFEGTGLTGITIPESVTTIGENAFTGTQITEVTLSANVTSIGAGAFKAGTTIKAPGTSAATAWAAKNGCTVKDTTPAKATPTATPTPTPKPTAKPTTKPTVKPTTKPTATPTPKPTATSTSKPTAAPTPSPTARPALTDIGKAKVSTIRDQDYTGKKIKPKFTVKYKGTTLKEGTDYTVNWKNNKNIGTAKITIKGKGSYTGSKEITFKIIPKAVELKDLKADTKQLTVKWKKGSKIDGYEIEYSLKKDFSDSKKVTVKGAGKTSKVIKKLKSGKNYYVRVRTFRKVGGKTYHSKWSKTRKKKVK